MHSVLSSEILKIEAAKEHFAFLNLEIIHHIEGIDGFLRSKNRLRSRSEDALNSSLWHDQAA